MLWSGAGLVKNRTESCLAASEAIQFYSIMGL